MKVTPSHGDEICRLKPNVAEKLFDAIDYHEKQFTEDENMKKYFRFFLWIAVRPLPWLSRLAG